MGGDLTQIPFNEKRFENCIERNLSRRGCTRCESRNTNPSKQDRALRSLSIVRKRVVTATIDRGNSSYLGQRPVWNSVQSLALTRVRRTPNS